VPIRDSASFVTGTNKRVGLVFAQELAGVRAQTHIHDGTVQFPTLRGVNQVWRKELRAREPKAPAMPE
jgi:hypothetical protein